MRYIGFALCLAVSLPATAFAQPSQASAATAVSRYSIAETEVGTLLDDPASRAVLDKHVPGFSSNEQIELARGMTLRTLQQFVPDRFTDKVLADIDADLAKLK